MAGHRAERPGVLRLPPVRRLLLAVTILAITGLASACQRPTAEQCERLCWRFNELGFWEAFEAETASLAPDAREKLRAERQKTFSEMRARKFDPGLDNCRRDCRRGASPDDVDCVERARTTAQARECSGLE